MDFACGLRRLCSALYRPCAHLLRPRGKVAYKPKQLVARLYQLIKTAFANAQFFNKRLLFFGRKLGNFLLHLRAYGYDLRVFVGHGLLQRIHKRVVRLAYVAF